MWQRLEINCLSSERNGAVYEVNHKSNVFLCCRLFDPTVYYGVIGNKREIKKLSDEPRWGMFSSVGGNATALRNLFNGDRIWIDFIKAKLKMQSDQSNKRVKKNMLKALSLTVRPMRSSSLKIAFIGFCVIIAVALPSHNAGLPTHEAHAPRESFRRGLVLSTHEVPKVEPVALKVVSSRDARAFNAAIPISSQPNLPARPLIFPGSGNDRARALSCLTAAVLYEAGDDPTGQRAVAQVILNRVRHPAFPKTICGVVFQGSERRTGCQFTFTCDGSLRRSFSDKTWLRAGMIANEALSGSVYRPVGQATHYHTNWVVPYWSASLDKIAMVGTHLFFRWTGWWGTPPAFRFGPTGIEPHVEKLASRFPEHASGDELLSGRSGNAGIDPTLIGENAQDHAVSDDVIFAHLLPKNGDSFPDLAARACGTRAYCWFVGWTDLEKIPRNKSANFSPTQRESMSFSYLYDRKSGFSKMLWNCHQFKRPAEQCLRGEAG